MKKVFLMFLCLASVFVIAQRNMEKYSPFGNAWKYVGGKGFATGGYSFQFFYLDLAFNQSGQPYIAFTDWLYSGKASVMKFNGTSWENVGDPGFSIGMAGYVSLAFSPSSQPYLAYMDVSDSSRAKVMRFDGANWLSVGNGSVSEGEAFFLSLCFSLNGEPFLAYEDFSNSRKVTVKKFDGNDWVAVGNPGISAGQAWYTSLAFNPMGEPYVGFTDVYHSEKATVMKYNGTNWVNVGNAGFSERIVWDVKIAFNLSDSVLYIAYKDFDGSLLYMSNVEKFTGSDWEFVGEPRFSPGMVYYQSFAISPTGEPYVAFGDDANSGKATVMKFNGTEWQFTGPPGFSAGEELWQVDIAVSPSGIPYIFYKDLESAYGHCILSVLKYDSVFTGIHKSIDSLFSLFPNPVLTHLTFLFDDVYPKIKCIAIYNLQGMKVLELRTSETRIMVNIENFPSGFYFVTIETPYASYFRKFCKQ